MSKKVVTFGEIMLHCKLGYEKVYSGKSFDVVYSGGEANIAVSLANYGLDAAFVTKLPNNPIRDACISERKYNVNTSHVQGG